MNNTLTTAQQLQVLAAAGIHATTTQPTSGQWADMGGGIYIAGPGPTEGLTDQQFNFAADVMDPHSNLDSLVRHAQSIGVNLAGTPLGQVSAPQNPFTPPTSSDTSAPAAAAPGFTPTPFTPQDSGVADPFQPVGQGFGTDYGLPTQDPNFAFGNPTGDQTIPVQTTGVTPGQQTGQQPIVQPVQPGQLPGSRLQSPGTPTSATAGRAAFGRQPGIFNTDAASPTAPPAAVTGTPPTPAAAPASTGGSSDQQNALADLTSVLNTYGLGSMASWAWQEIVNGASEAQVLLDLYQTPQFKQAFPEIAARQAAGLPALSPGDVINYRTQATQIMKAAGLPSGFWDTPADFTSLLENDVSLSELNQRVGLAQQAAYQVPADVRATLQRDYGVGPGQLAAFFLDPKTAEPLIQRDFTAAQIGGAAYRTGYGSTKSQDEMLTDLGVNPNQAQSGFNQLVQQRQLFSSLPGENTTGITRDDQLAAQFGGNSLAQEQIQRRAATRVAQFAGGGSFTGGNAGFTGIGTEPA